MRVKTVAVGVRRKYNLGNYESVELDVTMWAEVDEDEEPNRVAAYLFEECKSLIREQSPKNKPPANERYSKFGLPASRDEISFFEEDQ